MRPASAIIALAMVLPIFAYAQGTDTEWNKRRSSNFFLEDSFGDGALFFDDGFTADRTWDVAIGGPAALYIAKGFPVGTTTRTAIWRVTSEAPTGYTLLADLLTDEGLVQPISTPDGEPVSWESTDTMQWGMRIADAVSPHWFGATPYGTIITTHGAPTGEEGNAETLEFRVDVPEGTQADFLRARMKLTVFSF